MESKFTLYWKVSRALKRAETSRRDAKMFNSTAPSPFIHRRSRYPSILCSHPSPSTLPPHCPRSVYVFSWIWRIDRSLSFYIFILLIAAPAMPAAHLILGQIEKYDKAWYDYKLQRLMGITQWVIHVNLCEFSVNCIWSISGGALHNILPSRRKVLHTACNIMQQLIESNVLYRNSVAIKSSYRNL